MFFLRSVCSTFREIIKISFHVSSRFMLFPTFLEKLFPGRCFVTSKGFGIISTNEQHTSLIHRFIGGECLLRFDINANVLITHTCTPNVKHVEITS